MNGDDIRNTFDELDDLLDAERTALLAGNLEEVSRLFDRKSRLVEAVSAFDEIEEHKASALRNKLERNQDLLGSAAEGVRSVARRLAAIRRVRESLETYDARGQRSTVDLKQSGSLEKRA
ncbi:flagellar biosynthesis protein FlgN [uncultured Tateyamaria sp.]|uniref:flagellar biosynthesis protein FlgN n=1 Tax=uncultured Tateyamaria sp. TaxID=455651 RepID=UPI00262BEE34|nr:flagellar biosynthesis protein FlgN [uncultured Tateyamaria sp.]